MMTINTRLTPALRTLTLEISGLKALEKKFDEEFGVNFINAIDRIKTSKGRVILSGMGKSGHICKKIAATLASTGTPSYFVHPAEASHGDLGMITSDDVILALSWSGETKELGDMINYSRRFNVQLIAVTSNAHSALGKAADCLLLLPKAEEACPNGQAPTTSTLIQLALGDALAMTLLSERGFSALNFKDFHPGGKLGANLKYVRDIMHIGDAMPLLPVSSLVGEGILVMSGKGFGTLGVINAQGELLGIVTDGDLRRNMSPTLLEKTVESIMTASSFTASPHQLVSEVLERLSSRRINALFVVENNKPVGILHFHDVLRAGVA